MPRDTSIATVNANSPVSAGSDVSTTICDNASALDLNSIIAGESSVVNLTRLTGTGGSLSGSTFTPAVEATNSSFRYVVTGIVLAEMIIQWLP